MGLAPKILSVVFGAVQEMNAQGKTVLLVEQNARAGLRIAGHGVVLENGRVRLTGTGTEVLEHPEIGMLYLGGTSGTGQPDTAPPEEAQPAAAQSGGAQAGPGPSGTGPSGTGPHRTDLSAGSQNGSSHHGRNQHGPAA
jgi:hypothetical protein